MSLKPIVVGVPRIQGETNDNQDIQWVITALNGDQGLSLTKPKGRIRVWCQCFHGGQKVRMKLSSRKGVLSIENCQEESHKSHKGLEELWNLWRPEGEEEHR